MPSQRPSDGHISSDDFFYCPPSYFLGGEISFSSENVRFSHSILHNLYIPIECFSYLVDDIVQWSRNRMIIFARELSGYVLFAYSQWKIYREYLNNSFLFQIPHLPKIGIPIESIPFWEKFFTILFDSSEMQQLLNCHQVWIFAKLCDLARELFWRLMSRKLFLCLCIHKASCVHHPSSFLRTFPRTVSNITPFTPFRYTVPPPSFPNLSSGISEPINDRVKQLEDLVSKLSESITKLTNLGNPPSTTAPASQRSNIPRAPSPVPHIPNPVRIRPQAPATEAKTRQATIHPSPMTRASRSIPENITDEQIGHLIVEMDARLAQKRKAFFKAPAPKKTKTGQHPSIPPVLPAPRPASIHASSTAARPIRPPPSTRIVSRFEEEKEDEQSGEDDIWIPELRPGQIELTENQLLWRERQKNNAYSYFSAMPLMWNNLMWYNRKNPKAVEQLMNVASMEASKSQPEEGKDEGTK